MDQQNISAFPRQRRVISQGRVSCVAVKGAQFKRVLSNNVHESRPVSNRSEGASKCPFNGRGIVAIPFAALSRRKDAEAGKKRQ